MHFVDRHREKIRQSPMSSRLLWACLLLVVLWCHSITSGK